MKSTDYSATDAQALQRIQASNSATLLSDSERRQIADQKALILIYHYFSTTRTYSLFLVCFPCVSVTILSLVPSSRPRRRIKERGKEALLLKEILQLDVGNFCLYFCLLSSLVSSFNAPPWSILCSSVLPTTHPLNSFFFILTISLSQSLLFFVFRFFFLIFFNFNAGFVTNRE